ncbi:MAG: C-GCAxxG-C-C family protein [Candidatus Gracilibacteria bacterium]
MQKKSFPLYTEDLLIKGYNCGEAVVRVLSRELDLEVSNDVLKISAFTNGGGQAGGQCGILNGGLIILSLMCGRYSNDTSREPLQSLARKLTREFEDKFKSLLCREIRSEGFNASQLESICNKRIVEGVGFLLDFFKRNSLEIKKKRPFKKTDSSCAFKCA